MDHEFAKLTSKGFLMHVDGDDFNLMDEIDLLVSCSVINLITNFFIVHVHSQSLIFLSPPINVVQM